MKPLIKLTVLILITGFITYMCNAQERTVTFDEYQIHINLTGKGKPAVIIEAGLGSGFDAYDTLQKAVSPYTKVLSYDRPGLGNSRKSPNPRTLPNYVKELRLLLLNEKVDPAMLDQLSQDGVGVLRPS